MAAAQVEVAGEAEHQEEILQETEQVEAVKVQQEQEATSVNIQEEKGGACDDDHTDEELKS